MPVSTEWRVEDIRDDLKGVFRGDLLFDALTRALYSTDGSIFEVRPLGVARPLDEQDLQVLVRYAAEHRLPLVPRGAGTGIAGQALGQGLIVDLSRHLRAVLEIGTDTVRAQAGASFEEISVRLARVGRRLLCLPLGGGPATLGGMIANNASGPSAAVHGYVHRHVQAMRAVLDSGDAVAISTCSRTGMAALPEGHLGDIVATVVQLLIQESERIAACPPRPTFDRCGYAVREAIANESLNLVRLLAGSEGTLAIISEATLRTGPLPRGRGLTAIGFSSIDAALAASPRALAAKPVACQIIDHRLVALSRAGDSSLAALLPPVAEAVLLVEFESDSEAEGQRAAGDLARYLQLSKPSPTFAVTARDNAETKILSRLQVGAHPTLQGLRGLNRPVFVIDDVAVPYCALSGFVRAVQETLQRREFTAFLVVDVASGHVHARPFSTLEGPQEGARLWALAEEVHGLALELGGTVSSRHGTGLARTPWVPRQCGAMYEVFGQLKAIFDPRGIFNPGKIVASGSALPVWPIRRAIQVPSDKGGAANGSAGHRDTGRVAPFPLRLAEWRTETANCSGCGACRTQASAQRMCPLFRATHMEEATPRAKANLMRSILNAETDPRLLSSVEVRAIADLCVNCQMCARECPSQVNIPRLMLQAKAANVAEHGLDRSDWVLARTEAFAAIGSAFALLVNAALASGTARWLLEKLFGVSRRRRLPPFAARSFLERAARRGLTRRPRRGKPFVAYFVDIFANYNDPALAEAIVAVLHHNGVEVYVPPGQVGSGMAALAQGDAESAREAAQTNVRILAEIAREGHPILCSEPSAALMLRQEYPELLGDSDAKLVAGQVVEFTTFIGEIYRQGHFRTDFRSLPVPVGHHVPCHLKALGGNDGNRPLLSLIPELRLNVIDVGCSGMAGTFGLKAENYDVSLQAGRPMLTELARPSIRFGATECSSCRIQMEHATQKRTLHPAQYLALAYDLMPELSRRLQEPIRELVLR